MTRFFAKILALAGLALALSATAASAAPAIALANASVRNGPGLGYGVVDRLDLGERVQVMSCGRKWCEVHHIGPDGYVARSLLVNPYYSTVFNYYQFPPKLLHQPGRQQVGR
jgi:uncharacterized protein YraI